MGEDNEFGTGVASVFDAIASEREGKRSAKARRQSKPAALDPKSDPQQGDSRDDAAREAGERPKARPGRFPGTKNGEPKEKITGRIPPRLKDAYVEWALDDRCALGELVERALTEFYQRHRVT